MDVVIIAASPRPASQSHSAAFAAAFSEGISRAGLASQFLSLADQTQWTDAENAFLSAAHVVFILPIFCGMLPGFTTKFFQQLSEQLPKTAHLTRKRKIGFILHGGLPENCDYELRRQYLKTLPAMLNSSFAGILGLGDTLRFAYVDSHKEQTLQFLREAGERYARNACIFSPPELFWGANPISEEDRNAYCKFINRFNRHVALAQGCEENLSSQPYKNVD